MTLLLRPSNESPIYEVRPKHDGGYTLAPYFAEPDGATEMTAEQFADFRTTVQRCGGTLTVMGSGRP